ncbi:polysaccharide pyruvyl transferase family protein [Enterococcus faecium]|uniref:polysaccharide pyruvyl transferase family protein n=1 Tax=Enterococcus faecium TaxID=1352 RepID=UPI0031383B9C
MINKMSFYIKKYMPMSIKLKIIENKFKIDVKKSQNKVTNSFLNDFSNRKKIYVFLSTDYSNLGDHALTLSQLQLLNNKEFADYDIIEYSVDDTIEAVMLLRNRINEEDIITLKGGGNIGLEYFREELYRRLIINSFPKNKIVMFPQTVYFPETKKGNIELKNTMTTFNHHKNLHLFFRDVESFNTIKKYIKNNIYLVPDIVFSMKTEQIMNLSECERQKNKALFCLRNDREKLLTNEMKQNLKNVVSEHGYNIYETDSVKTYEINKDNRIKELIKFFKVIASSSFVVTDRLHGMIFCVITNTPCIVINTYNHKVVGQYDWIHSNRNVHLLNNMEDFPEIIRNLNLSYDNFDGLLELRKMHEIIIEVMREKE